MVLENKKVRTKEHQECNLCPVDSFLFSFFFFMFVQMYRTVKGTDKATGNYNSFCLFVFFFFFFAIWLRTKMFS